MSSILTGSRDSLLAFVTAKLPKTIDAALAPKELLKAAKKLKTELGDAKAEKKKYLEVNSDAYNFYVYLDKDARSVSSQKSSIRSIAEEQVPKLEAGLKMLEDKRISDLPATLVACTRSAMNLNNNFAVIVSNLKDIQKDHSEKDYAFEQLLAELEELDIAAGKDSQNFKEKLESFDAEGLVESFQKIHDTIKAEDEATEDADKKSSTPEKEVNTPYEKLRLLSLNYQKETTPLFEELGESVTDLKTQFDAMAKDLDTNVEALKKVAGEDKVAWQTVKDEYEAISLLISPLKELAEMKEPEVEPAPVPEANNNGVTLMANPDPFIKEQKDNVNSALIEKKVELTTVSKRLARLSAALKSMSVFNEVIDARRKELDATKNQATELNKAIKKVKQAIGAVSNKVEQYIGDLKCGSPKKNILSIYIEQLVELDKQGQAIRDLNAGISQVKIEGDIKLYFGKIAAILDQFPAPAKEIVDGVLKINEALAVLDQWATNFESGALIPLKEGFEGSSWNIVKDSTNSAGSVWTDLDDKIKNMRIKDEDLRYKDNNAKIKKEIIPIKSWTGELQESIKAIDKQIAEKAIDKREATKAQEALKAMIANSDKLEDWETFYTEREAKLKATADDLNAELAFLNKFLEQEA